MAGPDSEMAAGGGRGRLRASHTDRDHVINTLKAAYVYGYVTKDEFDARVNQTFASRTYAELALMTADLPTELTTAPAQAAGNAPAAANVRSGARAMVTAASFAFTALIAVIFAASPAAPWLLTGSAFVVLSLAATQMLGSQRDTYSGGQPRMLPGGRLDQS
jgi:hypothetical protein